MLDTSKRTFKHSSLFYFAFKLELFYFQIHVKIIRIMRIMTTNAYLIPEVVETVSNYAFKCLGDIDIAFILLSAIILEK